MLKITDSKTFQQIESTLHDGMINSMKKLNEAANLFNEVYENSIVQRMV